MTRSELKQLIRETIEEVSQGELQYHAAMMKDTNENMTEKELDQQVVKNLTDWYTSMNGGDSKQVSKAVRYKTSYDEDFWGDVYWMYNDKYGHYPQKVAGY